MLKRRTFRGDGHLLKRCCRREWRDWANLPSDLVEKIASRLLRYDVTEYLRLRAACKAWRMCTGDPCSLECRFRPRRWIMLSNGDGVRRCFLNLATGGCARVDLPELSGHHVESNTEGLLVLRDKCSGAIRLLNPFTRSLIELPSITAALKSLTPTWPENWERRSFISFAGISDETSPPSVALFIRGDLWNIAYAKPGDESWALLDKPWRSFPDDPRVLSVSDGEELKMVWFRSVMTLRGRIYFATYQGNILKLRLHPRPRLVPLIKDQSGNFSYSVVSYLVPADDNRRSMLMVRLYLNLNHLPPGEQRRMKHRKETSLIKVPRDRLRGYHCCKLEVFKVDLRGKKLVPAESTGQRAVFVGDVACVSLSNQRFRSVHGDAVYLGMKSYCTIPCGVYHLKDGRIEPRLELVLDSGVRAPLGSFIRKPYQIMPRERPCSLEEYLVCYVGIKDGIKD